MRSRMYMGKLEKGELQRMSDLFRKEQIRYAYFHCRDIQADGALRFQPSKSLSENVAALHRMNPKTKVIAWIGAVNKQTGGEVDLSLEPVRKKMASEAARLVAGNGFDGVQWDFEMCFNDDQNMIDLLRRTRALLPSSSHLSADAHLFWSDKYTAEVAAECDQIALMAYDTAIYLPRLYAYAMDFHVIRFSNAVAAARTPCLLMIGVPTYEDVNAGHHTWAESLKVSLVGVNQALTDKRCSRETVEGIAPYAEWTTDAEEWRIYDKYWLNAAK
jgi:hypothetical protein